MNTGDVITLENNKEYAILDILELDNEKYLFSVLLEDEELNTDDSKFFVEVKENDEYYVQEILDKELLDELCAIQATKIRYNEDQEFQEALDKEMEKIEE